MRTCTSHRAFDTTERQAIIDITDDVGSCRANAAIGEGMVLVSAMHFSASVFVNEHEPGDDNAAAHLRSLTLGHQVIVPVSGDVSISVHGSVSSMENGMDSVPRA